MQVLGYARVSTSEQAADGMSLDAQATRIRAWSVANGAELIGIVSDEAVSGTKALAERPEGRRIAALLEARHPEAAAVVVMRLDRLGRNAAEQLALYRHFRSGKVGLVAVAQHIDLATPHGRAMAGISAVFSELERDLIGQRTAEALSELRLRGRVYGPTPFGWANAGGRLVPDASEQTTLREVRQLRQQGVSYAKLAERLNHDGLGTKRGGRWHAMSVRSVLRTSEALKENYVAAP